MLQMRDFRPGEKICAAIDLPLRQPHPDFGPRIARGTPGVFRAKLNDDSALVLVLFQNPSYTAASLVYCAYPVQIKRAEPQPTGGP